MKLRTRNQATLTGMETALCACGCGQYFVRTSQPRPAIYVNGTHKKRAARARAKARREETRVKLAPAGWAYWYSKDQRDLERLWHDFTPDEQTIIQFLCDTGWEPNRLMKTARRLWENVR